MKWFRLYIDVLDDPKVQKLPPDLFKFWINILCLASKHDGKLPSIDDISFALRLPLHETELAFHSLEKAKLISEYNGGKTPHNWRKRQYKSDTSTDRVKRFRNARRNVAVTPPDTDTDTDTEQSKNIIKKPKIIIPAWMPLDDWNDFLEMRKKQRSPPTDRAKQMLINKLNDFMADGYNPSEILQQSVMNNYKGLFEVKQNGKQLNNSQPTVHDNFTAGAVLALAEFSKQEGY